MLSLYEGIILYEMNKQSLATSAFRLALLRRPNAKLPVQVAPKTEALFESVRTLMKQEMEQKRAKAPTSSATGPG